MKISIDMNVEQLESFSTEVSGDVKPLLPGQVININNDYNIKLETLIEHRAVDVSSVLNFVVDTAVNMEVGLLTTWLYDKCKATGLDKIEIDNENIKVNFKEIEMKLSKEQNKLGK